MSSWLCVNQTLRMETSVLIVSAFASLVVPWLQTRGRAFFEVFVHLLITLTVGSLTIRALSGGGMLLIPFMENWPHSPLMHLSHLRVYSMLAISLTTLFTVFALDRRLIWMLPSPTGHSQPFVGTPASCLFGIWFHVAAVCFLALA